MQQGQGRWVLPRSNLYRSCSTLSMELFLQCLCDGNLKALIIEGGATDEELQEAWLIILSEYHELKGDIQGSEQWRLSIEVMRLHNHLFLLDQCVEFLKIQWSDSIAESVRRLGYPFNPKDKENYTLDLNRVVNKSKLKYIQLKQLIAQLSAEVEKMGDKKPSREDFDTMLIYIEEMQKVSYNFETLTVQKYLQLEKKYIQYVEHLKTQIAKHGNRTH